MHPRLRAAAPAREHRRGARARAAPAPLRRHRRAPARVADGSRRPAARRGRRPGRRAALAARRARPHRAPDGGDAALGARPPAARRPPARRARRPAHRPLAPARAALRAARGADRLVADRRGPARAPDGRGRGAPQPVLLRGDAARRGPEVLEELERCFEVRVDGRELRSARGPARTWTATRRSGPRRSRARWRCTARPRCACCATRVDAARADASRTPAAARRSRPRWRPRSSATRPELPTARVLRRANREFEPLRSKLGFIGHRLANMLDPLSREPGYGDPEELRNDLWLVLESVGSEHVAHGSLRRLLWQVDVFGFHVAGLDVRQSAAVVHEAVATLLPGYRRRRRAGAAGAARGCDRRAAPRAGPPARRPRGRAAARARHGRAGARVVRQARRAGDGDLDGAAPLRRARRAVARAPRGRRAAARAAVRDARRPATRRPRRWPRSTARRSTATACAPTPAGS